MQRPKVIAKQRRQRRHQRPPPHHHARAGSGQLLVVRVEQHRVSRATLQQRVPVLEHLLKRARLVVIAAFDVEDGEVEEAAAAGRRGPWQEQVLGHEQDDADGAQRGRRATNDLAVEPRHPPGRPQLDLESPFEPAVNDLRP